MREVPTVTVDKLLELLLESKVQGQFLEGGLGVASICGAPWGCLQKRKTRDRKPWECWPLIVLCGPPVSEVPGP